MDLIHVRITGLEQRVQQLRTELKELLDYFKNVSEQAGRDLEFYIASKSRNDSQSEQNRLFILKEKSFGVSKSLLETVLQTKDDLDKARQDLEDAKAQEISEIAERRQAARKERELMHQEAEERREFATRLRAFIRSDFEEVFKETEVQRESVLHGKEEAEGDLVLLDLSIIPDDVAISEVLLRRREYSITPTVPGTTREDWNSKVTGYIVDEINRERAERSRYRADDEKWESVVNGAMEIRKRIDAQDNRVLDHDLTELQALLDVIFKNITEHEPFDVLYDAQQALAIVDFLKDANDATFWRQAAGLTEFLIDHLVKASEMDPPQGIDMDSESVVSEYQVSMQLAAELQDLFVWRLAEWEEVLELQSAPVFATDVGVDEDDDLFSMAQFPRVRTRSMAKRALKEYHANQKTNMDDFTAKFSKITST